MTWLPADSPAQNHLSHPDLWQIMLDLTPDEWKRLYGIDHEVCIRRLKQFLSDGIASRERQ